jgi:GR25 family glycosyltransferase involved in LPS biosynthesis
MNQPECFVIAHPTSRVAKDCADSLSRYRWNYKIVNAVDGWKITVQDWQKIGIVMSTSGKMWRRPGAQGCWFSHWNLWQYAIEHNCPIVIMEHDALVTGPWPNDLDIETAIVKLYKTADCKTKPLTGTYSKGSHAYTLTPAQAQQIVDHCRQNGAVAVDKQLADKVVNWRFHNHDLVLLNPKRGKSTTSPKRI